MAKRLREIESHDYRTPDEVSAQLNEIIEHAVRLQFDYNDAYHMGFERKAKESVNVKTSGPSNTTGDVAIQRGVVRQHNRRTAKLISSSLATLNQARGANHDAFISGDHRKDHIEPEPRYAIGRTYLSLSEIQKAEDERHARIIAEGVGVPKDLARRWVIEARSKNLLRRDPRRGSRQENICTHCAEFFSRRRNQLCDACHSYNQKYDRLPSVKVLRQRAGA